MADRVEREPVQVMFVRAEEFPAGVRTAWDRLESALGSLQGRKFYGAFDPPTADYRACVELREDDDAAALGLEVSTLPGGAFLCERIRGEPPELYERIGPTFGAISREVSTDLSRPSLEFYRRRDEIEVLLPISD